MKRGAGGVKDPSPVNDSHTKSHRHLQTRSLRINPRLCYIDIKNPKQMTSSIPFCFEALWPFSLAWQWPGCRHHLALRRFSGDAFVTKASLISFVRNTGMRRASGQFRTFIKIRLATFWFRIASLIKFLSGTGNVGIPPVRVSKRWRRPQEVRLEDKGLMNQGTFTSSIAGNVWIGPFGYFEYSSWP